MKKNTIKKLVPILSLIFIGLTITVILIISPTNSYAVRGMPFACATNIIKDTTEGNQMGWNPDGNETVFTLSETCYLENDSTVLVNIKDGGGNFESCNVDFFADGFFEVSCNNPPANESELHYMVLVLKKDIIGGEPANQTIIPEELVQRQEAQAVD